MLEFTIFFYQFMTVICLVSNGNRKPVMFQLKMPEANTQNFVVSNVI